MATLQLQKGGARPMIVLEKIIILCCFLRGLRGPILNLADAIVELHTSY